MGRHEGVIERLRQAAPEAPAELPEPARRYAAKVRERAFTVTDADVAALGDAGLDTDAIVELTVATALAAGLERLDAGLRALEAG